LGHANVVAFIESQRDTYQYIHDQALRHANKGYTPLEAVEIIELPTELGLKWHIRGYHGTLHHDVRAVYTKELGMWDGDPVSLHRHPPGRIREALRRSHRRRQDPRRGTTSLRRGRLSLGAEILHKLVFAQPDNQDARNLQADTQEQMGYKIEGPQWRGIFLTAAKELRDGVAPAAFATASPDTILAMPIDIRIDFAAVHLIGDKASQADIRIDFAFSDLDRTWTVWVRRGVLNARQGGSPDTQLTVSGPKAALVGVVLQSAAAEKLAAAGKIQLDGDQSVLTEFAGLMDEFDPNFNIITP
jgi:alkyl sulfatase BDS1-like metallo-beta-lactamase superfamily hydrolase